MKWIVKRFLIFLGTNRDNLDQSYSYKDKIVLTMISKRQIAKFE